MTDDTKEVQIIVRGGLVQCVHNWPDGLPGAVYDYDNAKAGGEARCPIEALTEDTNPGHVLVNTPAFDWLITRAMTRPKGGN